MAKVNVGPKISEQTADFLSEHFKSRNAGAEYILEASSYLYRKALLNLKGKFSHEELCLIIQVLEKISLYPLMAGQHLVEQVKDAVLLGDRDNIVKISELEFLDRLDKLSLFQMACLEIWAKKYWLNESGHDIDKYVNMLTERPKG